MTMISAGLTRSIDHIRRRTDGYRRVSASLPDDRGRQLDAYLDSADALIASVAREIDRVVSDRDLSPEGRSARMMDARKKAIDTLERLEQETSALTSELEGALTASMRGYTPVATGGYVAREITPADRVDRTLDLLLQLDPARRRAAYVQASAHDDWPVVDAIEGAPKWLEAMDEATVCAAQAARVERSPARESIDVLRAVVDARSDMAATLRREILEG